MCRTRVCLRVRRAEVADQLCNMSVPPLPSLAPPRNPRHPPITSAMQVQSQHMMACQESCSGRPAVHPIICIWPLLPSNPCQVAARRRRGWSGGARTPLWGHPHLSKQPLQVCRPLPPPPPSPFPLSNAKLLLQSTCKYSQSRPCRNNRFLVRKHA